MTEKEIITGNLKRLREVNDFTQDQVSGFLGIGRSAYSNYEAGGREVPLAVMENLCNLYGCELDMLYSENENVVGNMLATAFRVDGLSAEDMKQVAEFKRLVKNYLKMERLLSR